MKIVLVSGGVISGVGKGIIASSAGLLLKKTGLRVTAIKIDPYLNIDAGTLGPLEHGECFVLADGSECDLDLGNYERYLNIQLTHESNITTGKIYKYVIEKERRGDYLGRTVQVVPHITNAIQEWIERVANTPVDESGEKPDVCIIELGGTVGDIESAPFVLALVQLRQRLGRDNVFNIHVSYVPVIHGEEKTKPTQHAIKQMRSEGLIPDAIACRCERPLHPSTVNKIAASCQVENEQVVPVWDLETVYKVPLHLEEKNLLHLLQRGLGLDQVTLSADRVQQGEDLWALWKRTVDPEKPLETVVNIVLVGKYTALDDAYLSVRKSLEHASMRCHRKLNLVSVDSEHLEEAMKKEDAATYEQAWATIAKADGMIVPGGFGSRAIDGMVLAAKYAREKKMPYLGICLGMQVSVIETARTYLGISEATSQEFDKDFHPEKTPEVKNNHAVIFMPEGSKEQMGGTMRLGTRPSLFEPGSEWSKLRGLYGGASKIDERHRHRYEVNPDMVTELEKAGLSFVAKDESGRRMEVVEIKDHPFYVGLQAHPEFTSKVTKCAPSFLGFVAASAGCLDQILKETPRA